VRRSSLESEKSVRSQTLGIRSLEPESAKIYAVLDIKQDEQIVQRITLEETSVVVGRVDPRRGITPQIDLTQFDTSSTVSRHHARIRLEKTHFYIEDLKSRNKTRLGELTLTPHKPELLQNGDVLSFGSVKATFRLLGTSELPEPWSQS
jgi:pSer/pThr/pTyr-binding forkhead associated (FHA) protein